MVKKSSALMCIIFVLIFASQCFGADLSSVSLGDTIYNKPDIVQYFYVDNTEGLEAEAYLGNEKLNVKGIYNTDDTGIRTNYFFLVDESTSISGIQMNKIREALNKAADNLNSNETMTVIAFGENVDIKADHSQNKEEIKSAVAQLENDKGGTILLDVIKRAGEICNTYPDERNIVFIISDGADFNTGGYTYEEIVEYVEKSGITIYAVALGDSSNTYIDKFGQLARRSSGFIGVCTLDTIDDNVLELMSRVKNSKALVMTSSSNTVAEGEEELIVNFNLGENKASFEKSIWNKNWVEDTTPPEILSIAKTSETSVAVEFSEDVLNADIAGNYRIMLNNRHELKVDSVSYESSTHTANLVFEKGVFGGNYNISCVNITDNSMEKNSVTGQGTGKIQGRSYEAYVFENAVSQYWLLIFVFILIIAGAVTYGVISHRKGFVIHEKKIKFKDSIVDKERIVEPETTNISLYVTSGNGLSKSIEMRMYKSLIIGRDKMCDLSFNDSMMSRQHFVIEENDGIYTIMNLSSTNGTNVNGVPLTEKRKLEIGDVITAGNEKFVFGKR